MSVRRKAPADSPSVGSLAQWRWRTNIYASQGLGSTVNGDLREKKFHQAANVTTKLFLSDVSNFQAAYESFRIRRTYLERRMRG